MSPTSCQTAPSRVRVDVCNAERWDYSKFWIRLSTLVQLLFWD